MLSDVKLQHLTGPDAGNMKHTFHHAATPPPRAATPPRQYIVTAQAE